MNRFVVMHHDMKIIFEKADNICCIYVEKIWPTGSIGPEGICFSSQESLDRAWEILTVGIDDD